MVTDDHAEAGELLGLIADRTRRLILLFLMAGPARVRDMAVGMPVSRPGVSRQLACLLEAGLVVRRRQGGVFVYQLNPDRLAAVTVLVDALRAAPHAARAAAA